MTAIIVSVLTGSIFIGLPVAIAMGLAGASLILLSGNIPFEVVAQRFVVGVDSFALLAVPFFITAGVLMETGGITERLVRFANALVGHLTGGLGHVVVVTNMIMAGMSGSATADTAATGSVLIPAMRRVGFDARFSAAIIAAAGTIGPIIPPSIPFVLLGVMANVSVGRLFLGGAIPGVLMGLYLMGVVYFVAKRRGYPKQKRSTLRSVITALKDAVPALMLPVIIMGGILGGVFTPTEAAVVAVVYALAVGAFVYRELTFASVVKAFGEAALINGTIMFIVAGASLLSWSLARLQVGQMLINAVTSVSLSPAFVLIAVNVLVLVAGCFLETLALMFILVPVLFPLITSLGIDPVHFGVVFVLNLMIGQITPPVGICMYVSCKIAGITVGDFAREIPPYVAVLIMLMFTITFVPGLVLFLPNLLMGY